MYHLRECMATQTGTMASAPEFMRVDSISQRSHILDSCPPDTPWQSANASFASPYSHSQDHDMASDNGSAHELEVGRTGDSDYRLHSNSNPRVYVAPRDNPGLDSNAPNGFPPPSLMSAPVHPAIDGYQVSSLAWIGWPHLPMLTCFSSIFQTRSMAITNRTLTFKWVRQDIQDYHGY